MIFNVAVRNSLMVNHSELYKPNVKLMQYTGLKDNNGKDIYEGDICRWLNKNTGISGEGIITYFNQLARYQINDGEINYGLNPFKIEFEVIGNIYEDSDFITA